MFKEPSAHHDEGRSLVPMHTDEGVPVSSPEPSADPPSGALICPALEKEVAGVEHRLESLKGEPVAELLADLQGWASQAGESAAAALTAAHRAIVYAWATGCMFNLAKEKLGRGRFGPWRDFMSSKVGIKKRTAQHWMKLADKCSDVRAFLVPGASLTGAYRAVGILPSPQPEPAPNDEDEEDPNPSDTPVTRPVEPAFSALMEVRKRLRHLVESGEILEDEERDRLEEEKDAFVGLVDTLLNPVVP